MVKSLFILFALIFTSPAYACDLQAFWGGSLKKIRQDAMVEFWYAKEMAWSVGMISNQERDLLKIQAAPNSKANSQTIWIDNGTVYLTDYFVRAVAHHSIYYSFALYDASRFMQPEDVIYFQMEVYEKAGSGQVLNFYPYIVGLTQAECWEHWAKMQSLDLGTRHFLTAKTISHFWFLHEIAHFKLAHSQNAQRQLSIEQEYAADQWALEVLIKFHGPEFFVWKSPELEQSFALFSNGSPGHQTFISNTHPPISCRRLFVIDMAESVYDNTTELENSTNPDFSELANFTLGLNKINKNYLLNINKLDGVFCP